MEKLINDLLKKGILGGKFFWYNDPKLQQNIILWSYMDDKYKDYEGTKFEFWQENAMDLTKELLKNRGGTDKLMQKMLDWAAERHNKWKYNNFMGRPQDLVKKINTK